MRHSILPADAEFDVVGYGKTSKLQLQKGVKIDEVILAATDIDVTQVEDVILTLDADPVVNTQYAKIHNLAKYLKRTVAGNVSFFTIPFADFSAKSWEGQEQSGLQILNENAILKVKIGAATAQQTQDGKVPTMTAIINYGIANVIDGKLIRTATPMLKDDVIAINKVGDNNYFGYESASELGLNMLQRAFFYGANIVGLEVHVKSRRTAQYVEKLKLTKAAIEYLQKREGRTPIADCVVFEPSWLGFNRADLLNPELGLKFVVKTSDGTNVEVTYQYLRVAV